MRSPISGRPLGLCVRRPPPLAKRVHPPVDAPLLQSSPVIPAHGLSAASTFLGVRVPIATSASGVHEREHPKPASFRPRGFSPPRRLAPPLASRVCFTPQPRPGFCSPGCFPPPQGGHLVDGRCPLDVSPRPLPPTRADDATNVAPPSGPRSAPESVAPRKGLACAAPDPLLSFPSPGYSVHSPCHRFRDGSVLGLARGPVRARPRPRPSTSPWRTARPASLEARRPARGFRPVSRSPKRPIDEASSP
jgi:hypothetical protein